MPDYRSAEAQTYRKWYNTSAWQAIRLHQLQTSPLCKMCADAGQITAATVCDHIEPHKGDRVKFYSGPFQSLCAPHHNRDKQQEERRGYSTTIGLDGWPVSPDHPANR